MAPSSALDYISTNETDISSPTSPKSHVSSGTQSTAATTAPFMGIQNQSSRLAQITNSNEDEDYGWPLLAKLMVRHQHFEAFSRFRDLNVKNLLYYQVELEMIRHELEKQERSDRGEISTGEYAKYAQDLIGTATDQWDLVRKLRDCLKEYSKRILS
jgi:hypothetical protein